MRQAVQYLIFASMLFILSSLMHIYVFFHLTYMFDIPRDIWFWVFLMVVIFSFIIGMGLRFMTGSSNRTAVAVFISSSIWFGLMFMFMFCLMMYDILRLFLGVDLEPYDVGRFIVGAVGIAAVFGIINGQVIHIKKLTIPARGINPELRIVHLSDIHIGTVYGPTYLRKVVDKTNALKPDVVLLTGDLADGGYNYTDETFASINNIKAPVYFTVGNHEYYAGLEDILDILSRTKIKVLRNKKTAFKNIEIIGMDYAWGRRTFTEMLKDLSPDPGKYTILMFHNPVGLKQASEHGIDLMLSGHTHGGQFFPMLIPARMIWKYHRGLHKYNNSYIFTSTGVGTFGPPMRLGTNNQVVLIRLKGSS